MEQENEIEAIMADVTAVFGFKEDERPQTRSHNYLTVRGIHRTGSDTAMEAVCLDLVRRAYAQGRRDGMDASELGDELAAKLSVLSGELLDAACQLRSR